MTQIIDGRTIASALRSQVATEVAALKADGITPGLAVVIVGDDPASHVYVRSKAAQTAEVGMASFKHALAADTDQQRLLELIEELNADDEVDGILVQLPLPPQIDAEIVLQSILPEKDVDGFHPVNVGKVATGNDGIVPCTPYGALQLIKGQRADLSGLHAVVIGRSNIVGKPMVQLLLKEDCTVTIAHSRSRDIAALCRTADILVAAVGRPEMVKQDWIKPGAIIIDVGINRVTADGGKTGLVGDVDFVGCGQVAAAITPVPGGVGPMTIACLLRNTLVAAKARRVS